MAMNEGTQKLSRLYSELNQVNQRIESLRITYNNSLSSARIYREECQTEMRSRGKVDPSRSKRLKETIKRTEQLEQEISRLQYRYNNLQRQIGQEEQRCQMRQIAKQERFNISQQQKVMRAQQRMANSMARNYMKGR